MRKINKGPEPQEWKVYRETPGVRYQPIPSLVDALLEEQGYICAYCERGIPHQDAPGEENHRIDHLSTQKQAREVGDDSDLDYENMVICCPGNIANNKKFYHCDKAKGSKPLTISPLNAGMMGTIRFTVSGRIKSTDPKLDLELNENGLNLNNDYLLQHRQEAWLTVAEKLTEIGWTKKHVTDVLAIWENRHKITYKGEEHLAYYPFCSMICFMLRKKLANGTLK
jgi:uncharacterized protein (TIGR02646 family)